MLSPSCPAVRLSGPAEYDASAQSFLAITTRLCNIVFWLVLAWVSAGTMSQLQMGTVIGWV